MAEIVSTITSKGQITIPVEVRRHLHVDVNDKVIFVLEPDGRVEIKVPKYRGHRDLAGTAAKLPSSAAGLSSSELRELAYADRRKLEQMKREIKSE